VKQILTPLTGCVTIRMPSGSNMGAGGIGRRRGREGGVGCSTEVRSSLVISETLWAIM